MKYRYREPHEMKDSGVEWLGMIPKEWKRKKLKFIIKQVIDNRGRTPKFGGVGIPMLEVKQITRGNKFPSYEFEKFVLEDIVKEYERDRVKEGDILISTVGATCGRSVIVDKNPNYFIAQNVVGIRPKKEIFNLFAYYMIASKYFKDSLAIINKSNTIDNLKVSVFINNHCIIPSFISQKKIANFLDQKTIEFEEVIDKKEKLIKKLEEAKKSLISEVVTGKKQVINNKSYVIGEDGQKQEEVSYSVRNRATHEMKDSGVEWLGMIPLEWKPIKVKHTFKFFRGLPITKADLKDEGVQCLNYGEIHSKYPCFIDTKNNNLKKVSEGYLKTNSNSLLKNGDLVFADTSEDLKGSGNFTYIGGNKKIFAGYHTVTIRSNENKPNKYLAYLFDSMDIRKQIQYKVKGVKVYSITQSILKDIFILKSKEEQKITEFLDQKTSKFDSIIQKNKEQIEKIKEAKQSLISEAVTGKIEVL